MNTNTPILAAVCLSLTTLAHAADDKEYPKAKERYPFVVKVTDFYGAEAYGFDYFVDKEAIVVVLWDDLGRPRREVLNRPLTKEEARDWARYMSEFRVDSLKNEYTNPNVMDGLQRWFTFKVGDKEKKVTVRNVPVKQLAELSQKINAFVPEKMKMGGGGAAVVMPGKNKR